LVANIEGLRRKWPLFGDDTLEESIRFYTESHDCFLTQGQEIEERVTAVAYESLVEDPEATLDRIAARCKLDPTRVARRIRMRPNTAGKGLRNVRNSAVGVVKDANREAYERMDPGEAETIREALAPLRDRLLGASFTV
jgi:hypothetical protein